LVEQVPMQMGALDPGSTNLGVFREDGPPDGLAYVNDYDMIWHLMAELRDLQLGASLAIYEPGFLQTTLTLHRVGLLPRGSFVKLYFGGEYLYGKPAPGFGFAPTVPALLAYHDMLEGSALPWCVSLFGGNITRSPIARPALEMGGHLHLGLEFHT